MIVVLRALGLGDLLAGVPALRAIRRAHPGDEVVLAAPGWLEPLALHTGAVDRVVDTAPLRPLDRSLHGADVAYNLHGRGPESTELLRATAPRELVAFDPRAWDDAEHERARWCRLLREAGVPADPDDLHVDVPDLDLPWHADTIVHPGASAPARRWPASRWAVVAEQEAATGRQVHVTGTEAEADLCWRVSGLAGLGRPGSLAGKTGLLELVALVGRAQRVVCGDTGVAHVAWATGTPSLVLYGPTSPAAWGPPAGPHLALWRGRTGDPHAERPHGGLLAIEVDEVLDALDQLPDRIGAA